VELLNNEGVVVQSAEKGRFLTEFSFAPIGTKCLVAKLGKTKKPIKLTDETVMDIIRLLGIDAWKKEYGKISSKGMLTWGALLLGLSVIVLMGTEQWPIELILLEMLWFAAGCVMIVNGILAKKSLRPRNYILQLISSSAVLLCISINILTAFHWLQIVFFVVVLIGIALAIGNYRLFTALERHTTAVVR